MKVAILHEGNSKKTNDNGLIKLLLEDLNLDENRVEFFGFGPKSNFYKTDYIKYKNLKLGIEEESINKILFILDADKEENDNTYGGLEKTKLELEKVIAELGLADLSNIYVTCDPKTQDGYLESLILSSIPIKHKECIETFLECSEFKSKENHKSILNQIYKRAYPNVPFDLSHPNFDALKEKLHNLFNK